MNRVFNVLELLSTDVIEARIQLALDLLEDGLTDADAARIGQGFQAGSHVHPVAINIVPVNDNFAQIDADAEEQAFFFLDLGTQRADGVLNADGAMGGGHDTLKAREDGVPGIMHDRATGIPDPVGDQIETGGKLPMRPDFICLGQSAVSGYVGIDNRCELVLNILVRHH